MGLLWQRKMIRKYIYIYSIYFVGIGAQLQWPKDDLRLSGSKTRGKTLVFGPSQAPQPCCICNDLLRTRARLLARRPSRFFLKGESHSVPPAFLESTQCDTDGAFQDRQLLAGPWHSHVIRSNLVTYTHRFPGLAGHKTDPIIQATNPAFFWLTLDSPAMVWCLRPTSAWKISSEQCQEKSSEPKAQRLSSSA